MRKARLIKYGELPERKMEQDQSAQKVQAASVGKAVKTARAWVKEYQSAEQPSPRQKFAALFS